MSATLRPPGASDYATPRDVPAVRRKVLEVLIEQGPTVRRQLGRPVFGTDRLGATAIASAIGTLRNDRLVIEVRRDTYRAVPEAEHLLTLANVLVDGGTIDAHPADLVRIRRLLTP